MKTKVITELRKIPIGKTFEIWGRNFTVLESNADFVFVISTEIEKEMSFRKNGDAYKVAPNDFRDSTIREWLYEEYLYQLYESGMKEGDILDLVIDLKCTLGQHEYGTDTAMAGLLTLEQCGKYYDIIPKVSESYWLTTPWKTPNYSSYAIGTDYVWSVAPNGDCNYSDYNYPYGVRPVLNLNPNLLVKWDNEERYVSDAEVEKWSEYIKYLHRWAVEHEHISLIPESPLSYEDWVY